MPGTGQLENSFGISIPFIPNTIPISLSAPQEARLLSRAVPPYVVIDVNSAFERLARMTVQAATTANVGAKIPRRG